jgi:hypothetical protein
VLDYTLHELCACEPEPVPGVRPGLQADEHRQLPRGEEQRRCSPVVGGGCPDCAVCHADVRAVEALQKRGGGEHVLDAGAQHREQETSCCDGPAGLTVYPA